MKNVTLSRQFLALYLLTAIIGQGIYLPSARAAPGNSGTISVSILTEVTVPNAITNLAAIAVNRSDEPVISTGIIRLTWTAPGDMPGNDRVFSYLVKYATFSATQTGGDISLWWNHNSAKTLVSEGLNADWGIYSSTVPGSMETSYIIALEPGQHYWIAAKSLDKYHNESGISAQTSAYASTSMDMPGAITTLSALFNEENPGRVNLSWAAPGNDGYNGAIFNGAYRIMYSTTPPPASLNDYNPKTDWVDAVSLYLSTSGLNAGTQVSYIINGLDQSTTYFFDIWTADEWYLVGQSTRNWSFESNTSSAIDNVQTAPGPVTGFSATAYSSTDTASGRYAALRWTNPSKWNYEGVKICTSTIVSGTTDYPKIENGAAITLTGLVSGTTGEYMFISLTPGTSYFYSVYAFDKNGLNSARTTGYAFTLPDSALPDPVTGLSLTAYASTDTLSGSYIKLSWTNPVKWNFEGVRICSSVFVGGTTDYPNWQDGGFVNLTGLISGATVEFITTMLSPRTTFFYSLYAFDKSGLYSSRTTGYAFTAEDLIAPEAPMGLTVSVNAGALTGSFAALNWTNPDASQYRNSDIDKIKIHVSTISYPSGALPSNLASLERTLPVSATGYVYSNLASLTTYYFSLFNYDGGNNASSATVSIYFLIDFKPPDNVVISTSDFSPAYSLDESSGAMFNLSLKMPGDTDLDKLYIAGNEDKYPDSYIDGSPELSQIISNITANTQINTLITDLMGNVTYYFGIYLTDKSGNISTNSVKVMIPVPPDNTVPLVPQFMQTDISNNIFTLRWEKARYAFNTNSEDTLISISTVSPKTMDIFRYQIYESDDLKTWKIVKRLKSTDDTVYSAVKTGIKYYKARAVDLAGAYSDSIIVDSSDDMNLYFIEAEGSYVKFSKKSSEALFGTDIAAGSDIYLKWGELKEQETGPILKSMKIEPYKIVNNQYKTISTFKFDQPQAELALSYGDLSKTPGPSAAAITQPEKWLSNFYYNGNEWLKLPSLVDVDNQVVKSAVKFFGMYQIRVAANATELTFYKVIPKIITPNNDGRNDRAIFQFENPRTSSLKVKIFDITGALVKDLGAYNLDSYIGGSLKYWDGSDSNGDIVAPGTYIYQIEGEGKTFNGTIIVAR